MGGHDAGALLDARLDAATGHLADVVGPEPDGIAGAISSSCPSRSPVRPKDTPCTRGCARSACPARRSAISGVPVISSAAPRRLASQLLGRAGFDPVEINVLTELWRGVPVGSVTTNQMGWSADDCESALVRLAEANLVDGAALTSEGKAVRDEIESATDRQEAVPAEILGTEAEDCSRSSSHGRAPS